MGELMGSVDDSDDGDLASAEATWWSWSALASARGLAVCGFALAVLSMAGLSPAHELSGAVAYSVHSLNAAVHYYWIDGAVQGAIALLGGCFCAQVLRQEFDDEPAWIGGLARAGILIAAVSVLLNAATIVTALTATAPSPLRF